MKFSIELETPNLIKILLDGKQIGLIQNLNLSLWAGESYGSGHLKIQILNYENQKVIDNNKINVELLRQFGEMFPNLTVEVETSELDLK